MVGELADLRDQAPWVEAAVTMPVVSMYGSRGRPHHRASSAHLAAVLPDCHVVEIRGANRFGPNTPRGRGRRRDHHRLPAVRSAGRGLTRKAQSPRGGAIVTSRPKNVHVVSSTAPAPSVAPAQSWSDWRWDQTTTVSPPSTRDRRRPCRRWPSRPRRSRRRAGPRRRRRPGRRRGPCRRSRPNCADEGRAPASSVRVPSDPVERAADPRCPRSAVHLLPEPPRRPPGGARRGAGRGR